MCARLYVPRSGAGRVFTLVLPKKAPVHDLLTAGTASVRQSAVPAHTGPRPTCWQRLPFSAGGTQGPSTPSVTSVRPGRNILRTPRRPHSGHPRRRPLPTGNRVHDYRPPGSRQTQECCGPVRSPQGTSREAPPFAPSLRQNPKPGTPAERLPASLLEALQPANCREAVPFRRRAPSVPQKFPFLGGRD